jgi:dTDP-4-dehydrorhamnose reductase
MLGRDVSAAAARAGHEPLALARSALDITDPAAVNDAFERLAPAAVLNCAGWTDVDGAQADREGAYAVNADGAGYLAAAAAGAGAQMVHVSTDYVFSGERLFDGRGQPRPYVESDRTGPVSVYGCSKLEGERRVLDAGGDHAVVRTAWLFGVGGSNFVETMLRLAGEREAVQVVDDQVGCPTWTGHLAPALIGLLERGVSGVVHLAGAGEVSWNGFAAEIFRQAEVQCRVESATTEQMARPAPRPAWSVMESERPDVIPMGPWQDGLAGYLAARAGIMRV